MSVARLEKEGRAAIIRKYVAVEIYRFFGGERGRPSNDDEFVKYALEKVNSTKADFIVGRELIHKLEMELLKHNICEIMGNRLKEPLQS